jgi:hypothetical protein
METPNNIPFDDADELLDPNTLAALGEMYASLALSPSIMNPKRRREFAKAFAILSSLAESTGATIKGKTDYPWKNNGTIIVEAPAIVFHSPFQFSNAADLANNVLIEPMPNGGMRMAFLFEDLNLPFDVEKEAT